MFNRNVHFPTGSDDCLVKLWNLDISDFIGNLEGHTSPVTSVAVAAQEAFAVSGAEDRTVKVWSIMISCVITDYKVCWPQARYEGPKIWRTTSAFFELLGIA